MAYPSFVIALSISFSATTTGDAARTYPTGWLSGLFTVCSPNTSNCKPALISTGMALLCNSDANARHTACRCTTRSLPWIDATGSFICDSSVPGNFRKTSQLFVARSNCCVLLLLYAMELLYPPPPPFLSYNLTVVLLLPPYLCLAAQSELVPWRCVSHPKKYCRPITLFLRLTFSVSPSSSFSSSDASYAVLSFKYCH